MRADPMNLDGLAVDDKSGLLNLLCHCIHHIQSNPSSTSWQRLQIKLTWRWVGTVDFV